MTEGQRIFLIAAKEASFTRAAEKAFVTPQCLSDHIRRLERQYHAKLFVRKPKLQLTKEGLVLQRWLQRIQTMEQGMVNELMDVSKGLRGTLRLGMPITRGTIAVPKILPAFQRLYPNVGVQIFLNDTRDLEKMLLNGELDLFLGVAANQNRMFTRTHIISESLYLVIPVHLLQNQFQKDYPIMMERFRTRGIDLTLLKDIPLIQGHNTCTTSEAVQEFLLKRDINISMPINVSNFDILVDLCLAGDYATICSRNHLWRLIKPDTDAAESKICVFPIQDCDIRLSIDIIQNRDIPEMAYLKEFTARMQDVVHDIDKIIKNWLLQKGIEDY